MFCIRKTPHTKFKTYSLKTLLRMDHWGPKHVELLNVMNKFNHKTLCILSDYIYVYTHVGHSWFSSISEVESTNRGLQTEDQYRLLPAPCGRLLPTEAAVTASFKNLRKFSQWWPTVAKTSVAHTCMALQPSTVLRRVSSYSQFRKEMSLILSAVCICIFFVCLICDYQSTEMTMTNATSIWSN